VETKTFGTRNNTMKPTRAIDLAFAVGAALLFVGVTLFVMA